MSNNVISGRYELIERIGDGGMAVVYKAKCRLLKRFVAVKILKPEFTRDAKLFYKAQNTTTILLWTLILTLLLPTLMVP